MSDSETEFLVHNKPRHLYQYLITAAASLGSLSLGTSFGYSSPAGDQLTSNSTNPSDLHITAAQNAWVSSSLTLGLVIGALLGGFMIKRFGHRKTIIWINIPYIIGWIVIGLSNNFILLIFGRCFQGVCGGILSSVIPMYISEIASKDIRGKLGGAFQLMVVIGILYSYILGAVMSWRILCIPCCIIPVLQIICIYFCPDSPTYLIITDNIAKCKHSLQLLRGANYNIEEEFNTIQMEVNFSQSNRKGLFGLLNSWERKPFIMCVVLFLFQQCCGVTAVLFNLENIFKSAGSGDLVSLSGIIVGAVQVGATSLAVFLVDIAGRKILLRVSLFIMIISEVFLGLFFYLREKDPKLVAEVQFLPLICLMVYIAAFSLGMGPVPWILIGELMPGSVKEIAGSIGTSSNWFFAFIITVSFEFTQSIIHVYGVYWLYASLCIVALTFTLFIPEVKGKSLAEIERIFNSSYEEESLDGEDNVVNSEYNSI